MSKLQELYNKALETNNKLREGDFIQRTFKDLGFTFEENAKGIPLSKASAPITVGDTGFTVELYITYNMEDNYSINLSIGDTTLSEMSNTEWHKDRQREIIESALLALFKKIE